MNFKHLIVLTGLLFSASKSFANPDLGKASDSAIKSVTDGVTKIGLSLAGQDGLIPEAIKDTGKTVCRLGVIIEALTQSEEQDGTKDCNENDDTGGQSDSSKSGQPGRKASQTGGNSDQSGRKGGQAVGKGWQPDSKDSQQDGKGGQSLGKGDQLGGSDSKAEGSGDKFEGSGGGGQSLGGDSGDRSQENGNDSCGCSDS